MNTALQPFGFGEHLVRVTDREGAAWFVANDVCAALELNNARDAVRKLDADEKGVITTDTLGGRQELTIISESGVYSLIFKSRKPSAVHFRRWVTGEVLPALRKTGVYEMPSAANDADLIEPGMPEFTERVRVGVQLVREARLLFGREEARRAWKLAGLPDVSAPEIQPVLTKANHRQVAAWLGERCVIEVGHRENATRLFMDFSRWCDEGDETAIGVRDFAAALSGLGVGKIRSCGIHYTDLKLLA